MLPSKYEQDTITQYTELWHVLAVYIGGGRGRRISTKICFAVPQNAKVGGGAAGDSVLLAV